MIFEFNETESTSKDIKYLYLNEDARMFDAVYALTQTGGKGRGGKSFYSPLGGIYLSMLLPKASPADTIRGAGACVSRAVRRMTGKDIRIRPMNDIFCDGRKAGILTAENIYDEDGSSKGLILSVCINLAVPEEGFPEEIRDFAGGIYRSASEIAWLGAARTSSVDTQNLSQLLLAGLRSQLMYALLEEFKKLADPREFTLLLAEYAQLLLCPEPEISAENAVAESYSSEESLENKCNDENDSFDKPSDDSIANE